MIYVNQKQLDQVEYLIEQSCRGHHILFDMATIRKVFSKARDSDLTREIGEETDINDSAEKHLENVILQPTLISKKAYLENLSPEILDSVVRTYFSIVENNLFDSVEFSQ